IGECPRTKVLVWVAPTEGARGVDASLLAGRRARRIVTELVDRGVYYEKVEVGLAAPMRLEREPISEQRTRRPRASPARIPVAVDIALVDREGSVELGVDASGDR